MRQELFDNGTILTSLVKELNKLIAGEVIITNELGVIVASTDSSRIGAFHEGAKLAMEQKCKLNMTSDHVRKLRGVRKGVVLPIIINNKPIAVLGITGDPQQVEPNARLVQKLAELFIQDTIRQIDQEKQAQDLEFFVFDWLNAQGDHISLIERSELYHINIDTYTQVIMFKTTDSSLRLSYRDILSFRMKWDQKRDAIFVRWGHGKWLLLIKSMSKDILHQKLKSFVKGATKMLHAPIYAGVGQVVDSGELHVSYQQAERAIDIANQENLIIFEEDLRLDMLLAELTEEVRFKFAERTIYPLKDEKFLLETLQHWFQNNMSTITTATKMHVHKNTLHYRLRRIEELTNLKLNKINDLVLLYLGYLFLEDNFN